MMSNWAVMQGGVVTNVIVADEDAAEILALILSEADEFILVTDATGPALIGGDVLNDHFRSAQTYPSWLWDDESWSWVAPTPYPEDGNGYTWDEDTLAWIPFPQVDPSPHDPQP